jgi:hypothetical protein
MKIITDSGKLNAAIDTLAKSKIDETIQRLLVSSFYHRMLHGDNTFISRVLNSMPKGSRVKAAEQYVAAVFKVEVTKVKGVYSCTNTHKYGGEVNEEELNEAATTMWYSFKAQKEEEEYSREAVVAALRKAYDKALKKANEAGDNELVEMLVDLDLPM